MRQAADVSEWDDVKKHLDGRADAIATLTWTDVAKALRLSILESNELLPWRVWATTFLGAVEQRLLGFRQVGADDIELGQYRPSARDVERVGILEKLLKERS